MALDLDFWISLVGLFSFVVLIVVVNFLKKTPTSLIWKLVVLFFTLSTLGSAIFFVVESSKTENNDPLSDNNTTGNTSQYEFGVTITTFDETSTSETGIGLAVGNNFPNYVGYSFEEKENSGRRNTERVILLKIGLNDEPDSTMFDEKRWNCVYFFVENTTCTHKFETKKILSLPTFPTRKHEYKKVPYQKNSKNDNHECKLENAMVYCRGKNDYGQLGISSFNNSESFVKVPNLQNIIAISTGFAHTCGLRQNRTVVCWGRNVEGQLGIKNNENSYNQPVDVKDLTGVVELTTGLFHTCCLVNNIELFCWGANNQGQLGLNQTNNTNSPTQIKGYGNNLTPFKFIRHIEAGGNVTCLLRSHKKAQFYCTGNNEYGQLGTNISDSFSTIFGKVYEDMAWIWQKNIYLFEVGSKRICAYIRPPENETPFLNCWGDYKSTNQKITIPENVQRFNNTDVVGFLKGNSSLCVKLENKSDLCL